MNLQGSLFQPTSSSFSSTPTFLFFFPDFFVIQTIYFFCFDNKWINNKLVQLRETWFAIGMRKKNLLISFIRCQEIRRVEPFINNFTRVDIWAAYSSKLFFLSSVLFLSLYFNYQFLVMGCPAGSRPPTNILPCFKYIQELLSESTEEKYQIPVAKCPDNESRSCSYYIYSIWANIILLLLFFILKYSTPSSSSSYPHKFFFIPSDFSKVHRLENTLLESMCVCILTGSYYFFYRDKYLAGLLINNILWRFTSESWRRERGEWTEQWI